MAEKYITIQDAAELSGKSVQTIRRAIKAKKLKTKKQKTPQGFNYSITIESLTSAFGLEATVAKEEVKTEVKAEVKTEAKVEMKAEKVAKVKEDQMIVDTADFQSFAKTMERLVTQHADERQSFLRLVNPLQEKIFVLENQMNLLKAPQKSWYQVWK